MSIAYKPYNVVLLPPKEVNEEAIRLSKLIAKSFAVEFVLDGKNFYPHLTLFQLSIPIKSLPVINDLLKDTLKSTIETKFDKYFAAQNGFISWDCQINQQLLELHKKVINKTNHFRKNRPLPSKKLQYNFLTTKDNIQIKKFGSSGLLGNFRPHITLARLKDGSHYKEALSLLPFKKPLLVKFKQAAIGELSTHGTVVKIISVYKLN